MTAATVKIKTRLFERQESIQGLADRWGYSRHLVTKVIHGERQNADVRKRLARYMGTTVRALFGAPTQERKAA
jgi:plasmid maintenance system antidote protein VapI